MIETAKAHRRPLPLAAARTAESLVRRAIVPLRKPTVRLGNYSAVVVADLTSPSGLRLLRYGFRDPVAWAVDTLLRTGDCFIDGGANIGLMTLVGACRVGPRGAVISCEPAPATTALLRRNLAINGFGWVVIEPAALGEAAASAEFVELEAGSGLASFAPAADGGRRISVDVVRLDDLAAYLPAPPALVKLDIEGAEVAALRGAPRLLAAGRTTFIVEVEPARLARLGATVGELQELLVGYEPFVVEDGVGGYRLRPWRGPWDRLPGGPNLVLRPSRRITA